MEGTVALKHGLVARGILEHATVRSPLLPLEPGAEVEIVDALRSAGLHRRTPRNRAPHNPRRPNGGAEFCSAADLDAETRLTLRQREM